MTYIEFRDKYLGKAIDFDKAYGAQCFDVYRQYCQELGFKQSPPSAGAKDIWNNYLPECFTKVANTPEGTPPQGAVIIWGVTVGPYGHVAICDHSDTSSFVSIDQNWPVDNGTGVVHYVTHNYKGVLGWLIPNLPVEENMNDQEKIMLEFIRVNKITEGQLREGYGYVKEGTVANLTKEIEGLKQSLKDMVSRVEMLEAENKANNDLIQDWQSKVDSANSKISKLEAEIKIQSDEKNQWKNRYEAKLKETADKMTVRQLFNLIVKKLTTK